MKKKELREVRQQLVNIAVNVENTLDNVKEVLYSDEYRICTKDDYKRYCLSSLGCTRVTRSTVKAINESWDRLRKGYNFIIVLGKKDDPLLYSADYFSNHVLGD